MLIPTQHSAPSTQDLVRWHGTCAPLHLSPVISEVKRAVRLWPGTPYPLGATYDGAGTNFSVFSEVAAGVELCLYDEHGAETRVDLPESTAFCWHGYLPNVRPGQRYA